MLRPLPASTNLFFAWDVVKLESSCARARPHNNQATFAFHDTTIPHALGRRHLIRRPTL